MFERDSFLETIFDYRSPSSPIQTNFEDSIMEDDDKFLSPEVVSVPFSVGDHSRLKHPNMLVNVGPGHT